MTPGPRFRRARTQDQRYALMRRILRNYARFFPRGTPTLFFAEWEARRALGKFGPNITARPTLFGPLSGWQKLSPTRRSKTCPSCGGLFWFRPTKGDYKFCSSRCRESAGMAALFTAFPDWRHHKPVTMALRLFCYTHDSIARPPSDVADMVVRNFEEIMANDLNAYYDEKLPLTASQQAALRSRVEALVGRQLVRAGSILNGTAKKGWNQQETALFKALLNKVLPDMTAQLTLQYSRQVTETIDPSTMTRAELEARLGQQIAAATPRLAHTSVIDAETHSPAKTHVSGLMTKNRHAHKDELE